MLSVREYIHVKLKKGHIIMILQLHFMALWTTCAPLIMQKKFAKLLCEISEILPIALFKFRNMLVQSIYKQYVCKKCCMNVLLEYFSAYIDLVLHF